MNLTEYYTIFKVFFDFLEKLNYINMVEYQQNFLGELEE